MMQRLPALLFALVVLASPALADTLRVAGAGSLTELFSDLLRRFPAGADTIATPEFGPSGLMREKIDAGLDVDLFASADMEQARRLAAGHPDRMVINFTRNHLCAVAHAADGLTPDNMLDRLLDPRVRLATSTPGADPAGDYAWARCLPAPTPSAPVPVQRWKPRPSSFTAAAPRRRHSFSAKVPSRGFFSPTAQMWRWPIAAQVPRSSTRCPACPSYLSRRTSRSERR